MYKHIEKNNKYYKSRDTMFICEQRETYTYRKMEGVIIHIHIHISFSL